MHCCCEAACEEAVSRVPELSAFAARSATAGRGTGIASSAVPGVDGGEGRRVVLW
jgi:hypothetical protein